MPDTNVFHLKTKYADYDVKPVFTQYANGGTAINLIEAVSGEPIMTATAWVPNIPEGCVAIKNYSENEGVLDQLITAGIIGQPVGYADSGYVRLEICPLAH